LGLNCRLHHGRLLCERFGQRGGHGGEDGGTAKEAKYATLQGTHLYQLVVLESMGTVEEAISSFLAELGHRITALSGDSREISFCFNAISVLVQRFNSVLLREVLLRQPPGS